LSQICDRPDKWWMRWEHDQSLQNIEIIKKSNVQMLWMQRQLLSLREWEGMQTEIQRITQ